MKKKPLVFCECGDMLNAKWDGDMLIVEPCVSCTEIACDNAIDAYIDDKDYEEQCDKLKGHEI